jgi:hypothetical protein
MAVSTSYDGNHDGLMGGELMVDDAQPMLTELQLSKNFK